MERRSESGYGDGAVGKEQVKRVHSIVRDDENDTHLLDTLEKYILEHYPNPQRIGCLDQDALRSLAETPEKLDLADLKYLHIFKCAECTRDLRELRRIREGRLQQEITSSPTPSDSRRQITLKWTRWLTEAVALLHSSVIQFAATLKVRSSIGLRDEVRTESALSLTIDLLSRSSAESEPDSRELRISLPRGLIDLHLVLPRGSRAGIYHVAVARDRSMSRVQADGMAAATVLGPQTVLRVMLDLRAARPGEHFLGIGRVGDRVSRWYLLLD